MDSTLARLEEILRDYWSLTLEYVPRVGVALVVVAVGYLLARWVARVLRRRLKRSAEDQIAADFLARVARAMLLLGVFVLGLNAAGLQGVAAALFASLGASTLVVGFAFRDIGENFLAGVILAFSRPFRIGDAIEVDGIFGTVRELKFRYTHLKTFDGKDVYVPNGDVMNNVVVNYTADGFLRLEFVVGIAYEDDIDGAIRVVDELVAEYPEIINTDAHPSFACVDELAASTVNIKVRFWIETTEFRRAALESRGAFIRATKERLDEHGFGLPADITELKMYGPEESIPLRIVGDERPRSRQAA